MKKIIALFLFASALAVMAQVPIYAPQTLVNSTTIYTNVMGSTASNVNYTIDCRKQASVAVQISQVYDRAGTVATLYYFQRSLDNITWDYPLASMASDNVVGIAGTGNTPSVTVTNIPTYGCGYMRLAWITNASAASVNLTNLVVKYAVKISSP